MDNDQRRIHKARCTLLGRYRGGSRDFAGLYLAGIDVSLENLSGASFAGGTLWETAWQSANLEGVDFTGANLTGARFVNANLRRACFANADLHGADFYGADLCYTNFDRVDLTNARLEKSILVAATFENAVGLIDAATWLEQNFEKDALGFLVYKAMKEAALSPSVYIEEVVNPCRASLSGSGICFGTLESVIRRYIGYESPPSIWLCRIRVVDDGKMPVADLASVVVPYSAVSEARCGRLELLAKLGTPESIQSRMS